MNAMRRSVGRSAGLASGLAALLAAQSAINCTGGNKLKCGAGTVENDANECVPSGSGPSFGVIVEDFDLGDFSFTNVDVPENMQVGTPELNRTYTITNTGDTDRDFVFIQYGIVPVDETVEELQARLESPDAELEAEITYVGGTIIEDLAAGEERTIQYDLSIPATVTDGLYGFFFAVDALPMTYNEETEQYEVDYLSDRAAEAEAEVPPLANAPTKYAPSTIIIGVPTEPNLRVLAASLDNASFLLDASEQQREPMFTLTARMSSMALDLTEPVVATFELRLPGHVIDGEPGEDLGPEWFLENGYTIEDFQLADEENRTTSYAYDPDRAFPLVIRTTDGLAESITYDELCHTESVVNQETLEPEEVEKCAVIFNDDGRDDVYSLNLPAAAADLLGRTRMLDSALNPDMNEDGEIAGTLVMTVDTEQAEYEDNKADNVKELDVVFMAPEPQSDATDDDTDNGGVEETDNSWGGYGPYPYSELSNTQAKSFGNDWFGARYNFSNSANYDKLQDQPYQQYKKADNSVSATVVKQNITIMSADGKVDYGSDKSITGWAAEAEVSVLGYTVLNAEFAPSMCDSDDDKIIYCNVFETDFSSPPTKDAPPKPPKKKSRELSKGYEYWFMAGPVPILVKADLGLSAGIKVVGALVYDHRNESQPQYGVQFSAGPTAALQASVFGGVSAVVARGGVEGTITIISVDFLPTLRPTIGAKWNSGQSCWEYAEAVLTFKGPITFKGPNGSIEIVFYAGVCAWGVCVETKVFGLTIASFSTWQETFDVWNLEPRWTKTSGLCAGATPPSTNTWRSPTSCSGQYCNNSSSNPISSNSWDYNMARVNAAYKTSYENPNGCVKVKVKGTTEGYFDRVVLYNNYGGSVNRETTWWGASMMGWSGNIDREFVECWDPVTVALETDGYVTQSGVTVTFSNY